MQPLTQEGQEQLRSIAQRYGVSIDAAQSLLESLSRGSGSMAQFNHPELGGSGQWMRGGMIMIGDMFNNGLKATVDGLCNELSALLETNPFVPQGSQSQPQWGGSTQSQWGGGMQSQSQGGGYGGMQSSSYGGGWWPAELGQPNSSGAQNDMRYAYFAGPRRLAIQQNGVTTLYDTLDHQIGGVSQQQGGGYSLTFSSQYGNVDLRQLPIVPTNPPSSSPCFESQGTSAPSNTSAPQSGGGSQNEHDIFAQIERLAALRDKGILSEQEFSAKKAELLQRI